MIFVISLDPIVFKFDEFRNLWRTNDTRNNNAGNTSIFHEFRSFQVDLIFFFSSWPVNYSKKKITTFSFGGNEKKQRLCKKLFVEDNWRKLLLFFLIWKKSQKKQLFFWRRKTSWRKLFEGLIWCPKLQLFTTRQKQKLTKLA